MFIRLSTEEDKEQIRELIMLSFGGRDHCNVLENLKGRYLLAFDEEDHLLGMTGLIWEDEYNAYDIDWTCTHPEHRNKGVMHELFKRICALTDEDIYCSCWRQPNKEKINLYSLMRDFGFEEVIKNRVTWDSRYNCKSGRIGECIVQKSHMEHSKLIQKSCRCYEDLYIRRKIN